jgi:hypothetical protein
MVSSTSFCSFGSFPRPSSSTIVLSGSVTGLSEEPDVFGGLAALVLPLPGGGGRVGERALELMLPDRFEGVAGRKVLSFVNS